MVNNDASLFSASCPPPWWRYAETLACEASTQATKKEAGPSAHPKQTHW